jgi:formylglycine-generating enzyme required for sulfatase activity
LKIAPPERNNQWTPLSTLADLIRTVAISTAVVVAISLMAAESATSQAPASATPSVTDSIPGTLVKFEMVPVPAGTVTVNGATAKVEAFLIGRTEVTWDMYDVFALGLDAKPGGGADAATRPSQPYGAPDNNWGHAGFPVISVTHNAATEFCKWLSARTGKTYRLPTEPEWLRAAELAAGPTATPASREAITWHAGNSKGTTHAVGKKKPDALGLFDLFGNATEWVATTGDELVTRGGSFRDPLAATGPSARILFDMAWQERDPQLPKSRWWLSDGPFVGFRLASSSK